MVRAACSKFARERGKAMLGLLATNASLCLRIAVWAVEAGLGMAGAEPEAQERR